MGTQPKNIAIVGTGPAGLMAAHVTSKAGYSVTLFEKKRGPGRKLLIAGSSGLNISFDAPTDEFWKNYRGPAEHFRKLFEEFPSQAWFDFIHHLGIKTFRGTSRRYFVEGLKASPLLRAWLKSLQDQNVKIQYHHECVGFDIRPLPTPSIELHFAAGESQTFDAVCFALGGGSYEKDETPLRWPAFFAKKGLRFSPFRASNVGFEVAWPAGLLAEAEGLPLKGITLTTSLGSKAGDLMITHYGLEGTPIYHLGETGPAWLDLAPALSLEQLSAKTQTSRENLAPIRRVKKSLALCPAAQALLFHCTPREILSDLPALAARIKHFPLTLGQCRPISEAISSAGGLAFEELTESLMLKQYPGVFAAGEMLDWDAPTGGFLIQGCAAQGVLAAKGIRQYLEATIET